MGGCWEEDPISSQVSKLIRIVPGAMKDLKEESQELGLHTALNLTKKFHFGGKLASSPHLRPLSEDAGGWGALTACF